MPVITEAECKDQYKSTLDRIANAALLQYTLAATISFVFLNNLTSYQFLGFNITRTSWAGVSNAAALVLNLYVARNLEYLTKLTKMYPKQRRTLRFLTSHHSWFLNPFGLCGVRLRKPFASALPYFGVLVFPLFPAVHMLDTDQYYRSLPPGEKFWFIYISVSVLSVIHLWSIQRLYGRILAHGNTLWCDYYDWHRKGKRAI